MKWTEYIGAGKFKGQTLPALTKTIKAGGLTRVRRGVYRLRTTICDRTLAHGDRVVQTDDGELVVFPKGSTAFRK